MYFDFENIMVVVYAKKNYTIRTQQPLLWYEKNKSWLWPARLKVSGTLLLLSTIEVTRSGSEGMVPYGSDGYQCKPMRWSRFYNTNQTYLQAAINSNSAPVRFWLVDWFICIQAISKTRPFTTKPKRICHSSESILTNRINILLMQSRKHLHFTQNNASKKPSFFRYYSLSFRNYN